EPAPRIRGGRGVVPPGRRSSLRVCLPRPGLPRRPLLPHRSASSWGRRSCWAAGRRPGELATLTALSLFGGGCLVVLHGTEDAAKNVADEIIAIAADPPPEVVLVLTHAGGAKGKAL